MTPVKFPGSNVVYGENQPEYMPLPCLRLPDGTIISCWEMTTEEIETIRKTGKIYLRQLTFNEQLQPIFPMVDLSDGVQFIEG